MGREEGNIAEDFFMLQMEAAELDCVRDNDWYDFLVEGQKVEVKSARPSVRDGNPFGFRMGRFDFTDEDNRQKQFDENIWIAFVIRHQKQCLMYGFCKAEAVHQKRYISIHGARKLGLIDLDEFVRLIKND